MTTAAIQALAGGGWHPDRFVYSSLAAAAETEISAADQAKRNREKFAALNVMLSPPGGKARKRTGG